MAAEADDWIVKHPEGFYYLYTLGLPVEGARQPVHINIEFDASVVDLMIDRLRMLRASLHHRRQKN
jgi:hypothetical protein